MKKCIAVLLLLSMVLCGCGTKEKTPTPTTTQPTVTGSTPETTVPETTVPETTVPETTVPETTVPETTVPPTTAPQPQYTHPLTGEKIFEPYTGRPVAVMLNNVKKAQPQHGNSRADILFEMPTEGGSTRCMGIYSDVSDIPKLGAVRSARQYFVEVMEGFGSMLVHAGGSKEALTYIKEKKLNTINGTSSTAFHWDTDRQNAGYSREHTLFITGESILNEAARKKFKMTSDKEVSFGFDFADEVNLDGEAANQITLYFSRNNKASGKYTKLTYDEVTGMYYSTQYDADYIDGDTREQLFFRNIVILKAKTTLQEDGQHLTIVTTGSGEGFYACDGKIVKIKWSRKSVTSPFVFTLEDGTPITLGVGKTYIPIISTKSRVDWE